MAKVIITIEDEEADDGAPGTHVSLEAFPHMPRTEELEAGEGTMAQALGMIALRFIQSAMMAGGSDLTMAAITDVNGKRVDITEQVSEGWKPI